MFIQTEPYLAPTGGPTTLGNTFAVRTQASIAFDKLVTGSQKNQCNASKIYFPAESSPLYRPSTQLSMDFAPLSPMQKTLPYHAALMARKPQRTAPLIPLNSQNHTYKDINFNGTNQYVGKIGWGMDRGELA